MKLYKVRIEYETVIRAESEKDAVASAEYIMKNEADDPPELITATEISSSADLPNGWNKNCIPWGESSDNLTIEEVLKL